MITDQDGIQSLMPSASPLMNAAAVHGLDVEKILAGDSAEVAKAQGLGIPVPGSATAGPAQVTSPAVQSALATAAPGASVGTNTPGPSGTSANQPQSGASAQSAPGIAQDNKSPMSGFGQSLAAGAPAKPATGQAENTYHISTTPNSPMDKIAASITSGGAQSQVPAAEAGGAASVPASISPTGSAPDDPNQKTLQQASEMGMDFSKKLADAPTLASQEQKIQAQRTLPPQEYQLTAEGKIDPNYHPEYRPTAGRRIMRGIVGGLEGLAEHGIMGALRGAVDPGSVGATPYGAPTRQFSIAAQKQAAQMGALDKQQSTLETSFNEDTGRAKDVIQSINDIGKNAAAGQSAQARMDTAAARAETARVQNQLADIKQQVADFQSQGKTPTTYEGTVAAAALEKDPVRKAALNNAAHEMAQTEIRKFQGADAANPQGRSTFRQSMIDTATEQVKALQDKYQYDPRRNQYVNPNSPNDILNPSELTDKKNEIAAKLDKDLGAKKMKPLGVRFDPADAGANKPTGRAARQAAAQPAPAATTQQPKRPAPPTPTVPAPQGAADMALSPADGQYHYRDSGKRDLGVVK